MKRFWMIIALFAGLGTVLTAGESSGNIYRIRKITVDTHGGKTRTKALLKEMDLKEGDEFPNKESLEKALARQQQDLVNQRVFESAALSVKESPEKGTAGVKNVEISVDIMDSNTFYLIPYPKYSTNDGFRLGLKTFYDNAFGTMADFYLGTNITFKYFEDTEWENTAWTINPEINNVKIGRLDYDFGLLQQKSYSERKEGDTYLKRYKYYNTALNVSTTFHFGSDNKYYYSLNPSFGLNYAYKGIGYEEDREPFYFSFSHSLGYSRIDWFGNFREGYSMSVYNALRYTMKESDSKFTSTLGAHAKYLKILGPRLNFMTRGAVKGAINGDLDGLGSQLRGVEDSTMYGLFGMFWNMDLNIAVIKWKGVGEAQFQPFFDIGFSKRKGENFKTDKDLRYGSGADFILYLDKLKSLHARLTVGFDLSPGSPSFDDWGKYEIVISSSLSY